MARSHAGRPPKRARAPNSNPDPTAPFDELADIDARYGERLPPLLPHRLNDLVPSLAHAA